MPISLPTCPSNFTIQGVRPDICPVDQPTFMQGNSPMVTGQLLCATLLGLHALGRHGFRQFQRWNNAPQAAAPSAAPTFAAPSPQPAKLTELALGKIVGEAAAGSPRQFQAMQSGMPPRFRQQSALQQALEFHRRLDEMLP